MRNIEQVECRKSFPIPEVDTTRHTFRIRVKRFTVFYPMSSEYLEFTIRENAGSRVGDDF